MTENKNEFDAAKKAVEALEGLDTQTQERVLRWVAEKLGVATPRATAPAGVADATPPAGQTKPESGQDIKSFVAAKNPQSDIQFATTVAYYYRFEAPVGERKEQINSDDLQDAARKANHPRFSNPNKTLNNAHMQGLLDRGKDKGTFVINSVGENMVAMTLPSGMSVSRPAAKRTPPKSKK